MVVGWYLFCDVFLLFGGKLGKQIILGTNEEGLGRLETLNE